MRGALLSVLPILIAMIVVNLVMSYIAPRLKKREEKDNKNAAAQREVRTDKALSLFYKIAVVFITLVCLAFVIVFMIPQAREALEDDGITLLIIFGICLVAIYISTWVMLRQVKYNDQYCEYINALGLRKRFAYEDIIKVKYSLGIVRVSTAKKSFIIFKTFAGCGEFVAFIKEKNPNVTIII
ncbi:MAG: hypothetical protein K2K13_07680 [Clostridiales bacterium]|nr:hypothetical protein [Clostridiales bacterium]